ncbi:MAG: hypothetical protein DDT27_00334 [Dehalococcoidia bacterium]|nr:hypothetical protein [Chloroflexota bacterium]MBT9159324.1 hypothetical protein [Chloroflexota bacterium]MBT9161795.1 hypothetical protein [Chloroflexota bacterium]
MRLLEFEELIATFSTKPRPGRHVYLWHGKETELRAKLPPELPDLSILLTWQHPHSPPLQLP